MNKFKKFLLSEQIIKALDDLGFTVPTDIQEKVIPTLLSEENVDFHGQAQTGTGKTLAFGLPLLQKIDVSVKSTQGLIIAPTRELVLQITESLNKAAKFCENIWIAPIYGGMPINDQTRLLKRGVHIVIGTPGRINDHIRRENLSLNGLKTLVLDEADIMLDMGFKKEIDFILNKTPKNKQIWLFSATTKSGINAIKKTHMKDTVSVSVSQENMTTKTTEQFFSVIPRRYRTQALCRIIDKEPSFYGIIFCQTKILSGEVCSILTGRGYKAAYLNGDMDQKSRNKVIKRFRDKEFDILVATDVAARGIDVSDLTHVVNYSLPEDSESYVHRIGRTGRAGKSGTAITFINRIDLGRIKSLSRKFNVEIKPFEVPTLKDIFSSKVITAIEYFNNSCEKKHVGNGALEPLKSSINSLSKEQIIHGAINLLSDKFLKVYDDIEEIPMFSPDALERDYSRSDRGRSDRGRSDRDRSSRVGRPVVDRDLSHCSEVFLHVGSEDGIKKSDIVRYLLDSNVIEKDQLEGVRVIKKRSFIVIPSKMAKKVLSALKDKSFISKKVRMGISSMQRN